jgi:hypothetical protein
MQKIAGDRPFGEMFDVLRYGNNDFPPGKQRHFRMANVESRAVGKKHPKGLKRPATKMFLNLFGSHGDCPCFESFSFHSNYTIGREGIQGDEMGYVQFRIVRSTEYEVE